MHPSCSHSLALGTHAQWPRTWLLIVSFVRKLHLRVLGGVDLPHNIHSIAQRIWGLFDERVLVAITDKR
jgi:hypothetical protein